MEHALGITSGRAALAIAHPGHELRVHGWLCRVKPLVFVLTDGSGGQSKSRLFATERILRQAGAARGSLFGRFPDRQVYQAVLDGNVQLFLNLADELASELVSHRIDVVVGDAEESAILAHDLWRAVINRAVSLAEDELGQPIASYEFLLDSSPDEFSTDLGSVTVKLPLSDEELAVKMTAAESYRGLSPDIDSALDQSVHEDFRTEHFFPASVRECHATAAAPIPQYELHGERQVAAGLYSQVVRYHQHVLPILEALQSDCHKTRDSRQLLEAA